MDKVILSKLGNVYQCAVQLNQLMTINKHQYSYSKEYLDEFNSLIEELVQPLKWNTNVTEEEVITLEERCLKLSRAFHSFHSINN